MQVTKEALHIIRLITLFVGKYGYIPTQIAGVNSVNEVWLTNKKAKKFPLVRISGHSASSVQYDLTRILSIFDSVIGNKLDERQVLSLHLGYEDVKQIDDRVFIACIQENYCSSSLILDEFIELDKIIVVCNDEKLEEEYKKAVNNLNRTTQRVSLFPKVRSLKEIPLSYYIVLVCILICFFARFLANAYQDQVTGVLLTGAFYKTLIYGNYEWYRLLTTGFVHHSFFHLFTNCISLISLGRIIEDNYGKIKMFTCLCLSIICGSLFLLVANHNSVVVGLSGGIYGLIGLLCVYCFESGIIKRKEIRSSMIRLIVLNAIISFLPSVSLIGHLGGFFGGLLFGILISEKDSWKSLRVNSLIASLCLLAVLVFGIMKDTKLNPIYTGTDSYYINGLRDFKLEKYADKTTVNLSKYYMEVNRINNEKN